MPLTTYNNISTVNHGILELQFLLSHHQRHCKCRYDKFKDNYILCQHPEEILNLNLYNLGISKFFLNIKFYNSNIV